MLAEHLISRNGRGRGGIAQVAQPGLLPGAPALGNGLT